MLHRLVYGPSLSKESLIEEHLRLEHQVCLNLDRIRVPEVLFQPMLVGVDECGLTELLTNVLHQHTPAEQAAMLSNVLCTGGGSQIPGLSERLLFDLTQSIPSGTPLCIRMAKEPLYDAWIGASTAPVRFGTKAEYEENGPSWLKRHMWSNSI
jgi:actin-related protein 5